jgi:hypothetical protein
MSARILLLHIGRIVVDGLPASARQRFMRALRGGLNEMAESGIPPQLSASRRRIGSLDAGRLPSGATAEQAASQVLQAIRQNLKDSHASAVRTSGSNSASARTSGTEAKNNG